MKKTFSKAQVAREYRDKHGSEMPTLRLAKIMYTENKNLFADIEDARGILRYVEGKKGTKNKKAIMKSGATQYVAEDRPKNPYNLPESDETEYVPYQLKAKRVAIISDIHVPYHSISALTTAIDFIKKEKPDTLVILGDLFDFYQLSDFCKDPTKRTFAQEIEAGCDLLTILERELECKIIFKQGNHDARLAKYIFQRGAALAGMEDFELKTIINKRVPSVEVVSDKRIIAANELTLLHGHEFGASVFSPVNIARGLFLRGKSNAMCGHHHRASSHVERTLTGKMIVTWSINCLCELHPDFLPINNWNHGFAMIDMGSETGFEVRNYSIYKGKVM